MRRTVGLYTTLIRTHHITSRKKLARVKKAAAQLLPPPGRLLVRSGGSPGIMYAESPDAAPLGGWVKFVHDLRYKDFQCVQKPALHQVTVPDEEEEKGTMGSPFQELASVAELGEEMEKRGLAAWFNVGMGYEAGDE